MYVEGVFCSPFPLMVVVWPLFQSWRTDAGLRNVSVVVVEPEFMALFPECW